MNTLITQRVERLRHYMEEHGLDAFVFPSTDPHCGEYTPDHWKTREWISGFNGSAGTAVVTLHDAALWTDSRYFIAATEQLNGTPFALMKERLPQTPSIAEWLGQTLPAGSTVGMDGWVNAIQEVEELQRALAPKGIKVQTGLDPAASLWEGRLAIPSNPIHIHPVEYAGTEASEKLGMVRKCLTDHQADAIIVSALDDIAWVLNLRGTDIHCNPVFVSYLVIGHQESTLYACSSNTDGPVQAYLSALNISLKPYDTISSDLSACPYGRILLDAAHTNHAILQSLPSSTEVINTTSPIAPLKAIKSQAEVEGFRQAMIRDGVALVKFLKWLLPAVEAGGETEMSIDRKLTALRAEQPLYRDISFDTIAGYGANGAIVHYEATPQTDTPLQPKGLLLLDSGAQYADGTTDITRTIALGSLTEEERRDYTLALKGHIMLARAKFPEGSSGTQLDAYARFAMWQEGINYLHGTGHGVGSYLCVHEGPHQIRMNYMPAPLRPYMTVTNEPGIYREGKHGVRIENTQLIVPYRTTAFGSFLGFEPLTLCPIDTTPIILSMLSPDEISWLNEYHQMVFDKLAPLLDDEHRAWLRNATRAL